MPKTVSIMDHILYLSLNLCLTIEECFFFHYIAFFYRLLEKINKNTKIFKKILIKDILSHIVLIF